MNEQNEPTPRGQEEGRRSIYLIDGSSYLYRAFYALPYLTSSKGIPTNVAYGFTKMLNRILNEHDPWGVAVAFDVSRETFRTKLFERYKAQRPSMPEDLAVQIPYVREIVRAMGIPLLEMENYEADDIIGSLAHTAAGEGYQVVIVASDKDMLQLVRDRVILVLDPMKEVLYTPEKVEERFGIPPELIPEFQGLAGDSIDNVPGVKGIGPKTATKLLKQYRTIENLYRHLEDLSPSIRKKLEENREMADLSRQLVTIRCDLPVPVSLEDLRRREPDTERLLQLFRELGFGSLVREMGGKKTEEETNYKLVRTPQELEEVRRAISQAEEVSFDFETTSLAPVDAEVVGLAVACQERKAWYIPVGEHREATCLSLEQVLELMREFLEDEKKEKIAQNSKYEYAILIKHGLEVKGPLFDTMLASYLLNPSSRSHGLDSLAMEYLGHQTTTYKEVTRKGKKEIPFSEVDLKTACNYACEDADITLRLKHLLEPKVEEEGLTNLLRELEIPLVPVLARMELAGVLVDQKRLSLLSKEMERLMDNLKKDIFHLAGEEFNINSTQQLAKILFQKLKLKPVKKTKKGGFSTGVEVLEKLALEHPLPKLVLEYRQLAKLHSTYVLNLPKMINPRTGRIHTSFNQAVTATGRLSSSDPNLQNIPVRTQWGREIRKAFVAPKGCRLISADYSQIELRILAHLSGDEKLIEAFLENRDIHQQTAAEIFGVSLEEVTPEMRRRAKTVNFGIIYGMSPYGLSQDLGIEVEEAKSYIELYFSRYPGVKRFIDDTISKARETETVHTILGRRRFIPEISSRNRNVRELGERLAINTPIQGSAADIIKLAMIEVDERLREGGLASKMILQVHDELLVEAPDQEVEKVKELVKSAMEGVYQLRVPLQVDLGTGDNWEEAH